MNENNKSNKTSLMILIIVAFLTVAIVGVINPMNIIKNGTFSKLKGDVTDVIASARISCDSSTLDIGSTTTCRLYGQLNDNSDSYKIVTVVGKITSSSNLSVTSVTKNSSVFSVGNDGAAISYVAASEIDANTEVEIATITIQAVTAGSGSISFTDNDGSLYYQANPNDERFSLETTSLPITVNEGQIVNPPSNDASLSSLSVSNTDISLSNLTATVPNYVQSVTVSATPTHGSATVAVKKGDYTNATQSLSVGSNTILVIVTAQDTTTVNTITLTITRESSGVPSGDGTLSSITYSAGTLTPEFNPNVYRYDLNIPYESSSVNIGGNANAQGARVTGGGNVAVDEGKSKTVTLTVTPPNNNDDDVKTYKITVTRAVKVRSTVNTLESLSVTANGLPINIGTFNKSTLGYSASVDNTVTSINIAFQKTDDLSTVGGQIGNQQVPVGRTRYKIEVTSESGSTRTYYVDITRSTSGDASTLSSVNTLSKLSVSGTDISTKFYPNVYVYSAVVANSVSSVEISATPTDKKAIVTGTGSKQLKVGTNSISVLVTAENGDKRPYVITIKRDDGSSKSSSAGGTSSSTNNSTNTTSSSKDSNALLKELTVNNNKITISDTSFSYNYTVLYNVKSLNIKATPKSSKAKVEIVGDKDLIVGKNSVLITVTAEDGSDIMYVLNVTRKDEDEELSADSSLEKLSISKYNLNFDKGKYSYELKIKNEKQLDILYDASNSNSNVVITGNEDLQNGSVISIIVTAEDGTTSKYQITIRKSNLGTIILIISIALVTLGIGGALYYFLILKKKNKKVEEPSEIESFSSQEVIDEYNKNTAIPAENNEVQTETEDLPLTDSTEPVSEPPVEQTSVEVPVETGNTEAVSKEVVQENVVPITDIPTIDTAVAENQIIPDTNLQQEVTEPVVTDQIDTMQLPDELKMPEMPTETPVVDNIPEIVEVPSPVEEIPAVEPVVQEQPVPVAEEITPDAIIPETEPIIEQNVQETAIPEPVMEQPIVEPVIQETPSIDTQIAPEQAQFDTGLEMDEFEPITEDSMPVEEPIESINDENIEVIE